MAHEMKRKKRNYEKFMIVLGFTEAFSVFKLHYYCQELNLLCEKMGVFPTRIVTWVLNENWNINLKMEKALILSRCVIKWKTKFFCRANGMFWVK